MPTVRTDFRRDFATSARGVAFGFLTVLLAAGTVGCSSIGLGGGSPEPSRESARAEAPKPDAFAQTRAQIAAAPREPYWPFHLGELYVAADSTAEAIGTLNAALAIDPDYAPAVSLLSRVYYDAHMFPQGATLLDDYVSRHADAPDELRAGLALHYEALGDAQKADAALASCSPNARSAHTARVLAMLRKNDPAGMVEAARKALDADSHSAVNHNNYGIALLVAGRPVEARGAFRAALDIDDRLPGALYNMAIVEAFYFFDDGTGREWYTRYLQVASEDPDNLKAHFESDVSTMEPAKH